MSEPIRVILLSEVNSKLGAPFLHLLARHPQVDLVALVTSRPGRRCPYFVHDADQVDLEAQANRLGVRILRPVNVNAPEVLHTLRALRPDYLVVGNYQQILKADLLAVPAVTAVNFHPSPLPRYAGLSPFFWMVRNGECDGAVTAIEMDTGVDTGPVIMQRRMPLTGRETALELRTRQEQANVRLLGELIPLLVSRTFSRTPQDMRHRSYFSRPQESDYLIDFDTDAEDVLRQVRAGYRHPGSHAFLPDGRRLVVLSMGDADAGVRAHSTPPGTVERAGRAWRVAARDRWLWIRSIADGDAELFLGNATVPWPDSFQLDTRLREEAFG